MTCFSCFKLSSKEVTDVDSNHEQDSVKEKGTALCNQRAAANVARSFTFRELATSTQNFRVANLIGEGGFGSVYKGRLDSGKLVAVKKLNLSGLQGNQEFIVEVLMLSLLRHSNLVTLTGYCTDGDQRLLVYEYMPQGSLENHLFDLKPHQQPLDWHTRLKIALGAARGLEYLHCVANPPVIYRDLKSSNILLDNDFNPKLSDFGLAKLGPVGDNTHVSTRVMGTYGYCAPDYAMSGKLTIKSDIYIFGVVMLELITGRKAIDMTKKSGEQNLVPWVVPMELMYFASGGDVKKITLVTKDVVYKVSVRGLNSSYCLIFGKSWDLYKVSKGVIDGWNIHFRSVCDKYLRVTGYNLEGMTTDLGDNFRGRAHSCVTVASSCSKKVQIFAKGFFKHLNMIVSRRVRVVTCNASYLVDALVISGKVYGFHDESWGLLFSKENIAEGQKMVLCYLGDYKYRLTVFDHNGVEVHPFNDIFEDDRYDRVVDAAARQMVLVED